MSETPKRLMPEVLPKAEPVIPSVTPRVRVSNHMRHLLTLGATSLTLACPPLVCDPLPPPAQCRNTGSVLAQLKVSAVSVGTSAVDVVIDSRDTQSPRSVGLTLTNTSNGTGLEQSGSANATAATIVVARVTPTSGSSVVELTFSATCEGTATKSIHVVLTPRALDGGADGGTSPYDVAVTEQ